MPEKSSCTYLPQCEWTNTPVTTPADPTKPIQGGSCEQVTGSTSAAGSVNVCAGLVATECLKEAGKCFWKDAATPAPVNPTKPVPTGICTWELKSASSTASTDPCIILTDSSSCDSNAECKWNDATVDPTKPTTPSTPSGETPLFTKEFCHPVKVDTATAEGDFAACLPKVATECTGNCVWSNGKALIPDRDFCAPADMTDDVDLIAKCVNSDTDATCVAPCKWRRGKQAPTDIPIVDADNSDVTAADLEGPLFSKRFCHPVTIENWSKDAQACL
jgi:hypothetical protein